MSKFILKKFIKIFFISFVIVTALFKSFLYFYHKKHDSIELLFAFENLTYLSNNFGAIEQAITSERVHSVLVDFMQGTSIEDVKTKQNNTIKFTLEELGFENPTPCHITIILNNSQEEIQCEFKDKTKFLGNLSLIRNNNKWDCVYSGKSNFLPTHCKEKNDSFYVLK